MKLGLDSYSYHYAAGLWEFTPRENAPMTALHFLRKAAELGLDGVHLCDPRHLDSLEYGYVTGLREKADALGLFVELGTEGTNPDHLQNMVRAAHVLGSPLVRTTLGRSRPEGKQALEALLDGAAAELEQVLPVCERYGIGLALEPQGEVRSGELRGLVERLGSRWVGVCLNTGEPLATLEDPVESAEALAPVVRTLHLTDYQVAATSSGFMLVGCALGEGVVDLGRILDLLSPQVTLVSINVEAAIGKRPLPVLEESYLRRFAQASAGDLGRVLRLVRDRGLRQIPRSPVERGAPEAEALAEEDEVAVASVRWTQRALGRPEVELPNAGETGP